MLRLVLAVAMLLGLTAAPLAESVVPKDPGEIRLSFAPVVKKARPAVVNVYASRVETMPRNPLFDDPIFRQFFGGQGQNSRTAQSLGSGVIVDPSGLVVTNHHVIEGMTEVRIALSDRREFEAEIVLRDPRSDLAVLKIKSDEKFPVLELGDSDAIEVGDFVIAIGNPFGVGQTVTQGIVSARAHADRHQRLRLLHSDRRGDQSGQFRRRAGRSVGAAGRDQLGDLFALGRQHGYRLRHPRQHGEKRHRRGQAWRRDGAAPLARRQIAELDQGPRGLAGA
jgi:S1-C subfamily serine protease